MPQPRRGARKDDDETSPDGKDVIVYETDEGKTVVSAVDPMQTMAAQGDPAVRPLAAEVQQKLRRAIEAL